MSGATGATGATAIPTAVTIYGVNDARTSDIIARLEAIGHIVTFLDLKTSGVHLADFSRTHNFTDIPSVVEIGGYKATLDHIAARKAALGATGTA